MTFYDYAKDIISERLKSRDTLEKVIEKIRVASANGQIAFYPCSRYTRAILSEIKEQAPELLPKITGCFDKSSDADPGEDVSVYDIRSLDEFKDTISLLVVTSNPFYAKEMRDLEKLTNYSGPILNTSRFGISIQNMGNDEIISKMDEVYHLLADRKSRMTYLVVWLAGLLNDEDLPYLFESEREIDISEVHTKYKDYILEGLDGICQAELHTGLYQMRYMSVERGDVVFDIGAYKGDTAVLFADLVGREGKVYSFEPVKANYDGLLRNIKVNGLEDIVVPINKGCSDKSGVLRAISAKSGAPWAFLSEDKGDETVEVITIDDFVESNNNNKVDFVKMDVEGMEYEVISGARKTIERFRPKMVIPLYHKSSDLLTIPLLMNEIGGYKLYLRCKTAGVFGINLYCT